MAEGTMQYECWWEAVRILKEVVAAAAGEGQFFATLLTARMQKEMRAREGEDTNRWNTLKGNIAELAAVCIFRAHCTEIHYRDSNWRLVRTMLLDPGPRLAGITGACMQYQDEVEFSKTLSWFLDVKRSIKSRAKSFDVLSEYACKGKENMYILTQVKYATTKNSEYQDYVTWKETVLEKAGNQCVLFWWLTFDSKGPSFLRRKEEGTEEIAVFDGLNLDSIPLESIKEQVDKIEHTPYKAPVLSYEIDRETMWKKDEDHTLKPIQLGVLHHITKALKQEQSGDDFGNSLRVLGGLHPCYSIVQHCGCGKTIALWAIFHWFGHLYPGICVILTPRLVLNTQSYLKMKKWDEVNNIHVNYAFVSAKIVNMDPEIGQSSNDDTESDIDAQRDDDRLKRDVQFMKPLSTEGAIVDFLVKNHHLTSEGSQTKQRAVLLCTYQSAQKLVQAYHMAMTKLFANCDVRMNSLADPFFGVVCYDEAHFVCGQGYKGFKAAHLLPAAMRLSMTATPKFAQDGNTTEGLSLHQINQWIIKSAAVDDGQHTQPPEVLPEITTPPEQSATNPQHVYIPLAVQVRDENLWVEDLKTRPAVFHPYISEGDNQVFDDERAQHPCVQQWATSDEVIKFIEDRAEKFNISVELYDVKEYARGNIATIDVYGNTLRDKEPEKKQGKRKKATKLSYCKKLGDGSLPLYTSGSFGISQDEDSKYRLWISDNGQNRKQFVTDVLGKGHQRDSKQPHYFGQKDTVIDMLPTEKKDILGECTSVSQGCIGRIIHVVPQHVAAKLKVIAQQHAYAMDLTYLDFTMLASDSSDMIVRASEDVSRIVGQDIDGKHLNDAVDRANEEMAQKGKKGKKKIKYKAAVRDIIKVAYILKVFKTDIEISEKNATVNPTTDGASTSQGPSRPQGEDAMAPVHRPERKMLVRCDSVGQAILVKILLIEMAKLVGIYDKMYINCLYSSSVYAAKPQTYDENRKIVSDMFADASRPFGILTSFRLVETGWDRPEIDCACAYSPINKITQLVQFDGRAARYIQVKDHPETTKDTYDFFFCVEGELLKPGEAEDQRQDREKILMTDEERDEMAKEVAGFATMAHMFSRMTEQDIKILCTFETLMRPKDVGKDVACRNRIGAITGRQRNPKSKKKSEQGDKQQEGDEINTLISSDHFLLTASKSEHLMKNIESVRLHYENLIPESQSYSKREVQFYLEVLKHYYNEKKDPDTGVCKLLKQGEIYYDVSIDPRKQNPINLGMILDSWKQRANGNQNGKDNIVIQLKYAKVLSNEVKDIFHLEDDRWWVIKNIDIHDDYERLLEERRRRRLNGDASLQEIPRQIRSQTDRDNPSINQTFCYTRDDGIMVEKTELELARHITKIRARFNSTGGQEDASILARYANAMGLSGAKREDFLRRRTERPCTADDYVRLLEERRLRRLNGDASLRETPRFIKEQEDRDNPSINQTFSYTRDDGIMVEKTEHELAQLIKSTKARFNSTGGQEDASILAQYADAMGLSGAKRGEFLTRKPAFKEEEKISALKIRTDCREQEQGRLENFPPFPKKISKRNPDREYQVPRTITDADGTERSITSTITEKKLYHFIFGQKTQYNTKKTKKRPRENEASTSTGTRPGDTGIEYKRTNQDMERLENAMKLGGDDLNEFREWYNRRQE